MTVVIHDQSAREQALDPRQSFIVQAPAGSGKTELLTQRYLVLLSHAQKAPEEIIAITFTRKAAAEMRTRILNALSFAKTPAPDESDYRFKTWMLADKVNQKDKLLNWQLDQNPNRLRILTIDALATFLCRHTPMLTHFGMQPQICEQSTPLYQQAARQFILYLSQQAKLQPALTQLLLHLDNQISKVEALFANLLEHRDQWLPNIMRSYRQDETSLRDTLQTSLQHIILEKMLLARETLPQTIKQQLVLLAQHAGRFFQDNQPDDPIAASANWNPNHTPQLTDFPSWYGLAKLLLTQSGDWRKTVTIKCGFSPKDPQKAEMMTLLSALHNNENFKAALVELTQCPPTTYTEQQWETLKALTALLPLLVAQLTIAFQEKGEIDFVELNLAALKALGDEEAPTDLALQLDYQIRHLLIDEFQDTSVVQMEIIEKITTGWEANDGRTLFLVGDPMQSIYRFRNAEVGLFLRTQQQGIGNITLTPLTLTMNFRSQQGLIDWFNHTFQTIFPKTADIATGRVPYTPAIPALPLLNTECVNTYLYTDNPEIEAVEIVSLIQHYQQENANDTIAILSRSRKQLEPIIQALHQNQIAFQAIDIDPLKHHPAVQDLLSLMRALLHRADRIAWLSVLRAPFCGCTLTDLHALATFDEERTIWESILQAEEISQLSQDGLERIRRLRQCITDAYRTQQQLSFSQWLEGVWLQLGGPATLEDISEIKQLQPFFNLIDQVKAEAAIFNIDQFSQALDKLFAQPSAAATNVHIMTIHKSKGLEFDHVIIPGLHRQTPADAAKLFRWLERPSALGGNDLILAPIKSTTDGKDAIYDYIKMVENEKLDHEMTRLFYVAATRAKKSLHLFSKIKQDQKNRAQAKKPNKGSLLEKLWPLIEDKAHSYCAMHIQTLTATTQTSTEKAILLKRLPSAWKNPLLTQTISSLSLEQQGVITIPLDITTQTSRLTGTLIHGILQRLAQDQLTLHSDITTWPSSQWESELLALGVSQRDLSACMLTIQIAIQNILKDPRGQWILSTNHEAAKAEWALTVIENNLRQHVIIDRTFIDKADNMRWIIDYKIAQPGPEETLEQFLAAQKTYYQAQLENYAQILHKMHPTQPIKMGLYFPLCQGWISWESIKNKSTN